MECVRRKGDGSSLSIHLVTGVIAGGDGQLYVSTVFLCVIGPLGRQGPATIFGQPCPQMTRRPGRHLSAPNCRVSQLSVWVLQFGFWGPNVCRQVIRIPSGNTKHTLTILQVQIDAGTCFLLSLLVQLHQTLVTDSVSLTPIVISVSRSYKCLWKYPP